jgi:quercetin dioxygenase-like cupin family protein
MKEIAKRVVLVSVLVLATAAVVRLAMAADKAPVPTIKVVKLEAGDKDYLMLLNGPPETASLRSGLVTLAPGKSIGKHDTKDHEEMLVPLEGEGELRITGQPPVLIRPGLITYAPAHTEHDVMNTGLSRLRYIFIVAKVE